MRSVYFKYKLPCNTVFHSFRVENHYFTILKQKFILNIFTYAMTYGAYAVT
jgi:hypothetical protein